MNFTTKQRAFLAAIFLTLTITGFSAALNFSSTAPDGNDAQIIILQKLLQSENAGIIATASIGGAAETGTGTPEAVVTANPGIVYFDTTLGSEKFYAKGTGAGNTNWILIWSR